MHAEALMLSPGSAETGPRVENSLQIAVFEPLRFPFQTDIPRNVYRQHQISASRRYTYLWRSNIFIITTENNIIYDVL